MTSNRTLYFILSLLLPTDVCISYVVYDFLTSNLVLLFKSLWLTNNGMCMQVIVSVGSGPWDQLFGGGNSPALAVGAAAGFIGGIVAILAIPRTRIQKPIPLP